MTPTVELLVQVLELEPHPEGGWYRRTWTHADADDDGRPRASAIHYLLGAGERSHWHRVDADELWLWHAGGPLRLHTASELGAEKGPIGSPSAPSSGAVVGEAAEVVVLGPDVGAGQRLQVTVPAGIWQAAEPAPEAPYVLVSCVVVPAFSFDGFELAPPGWSPGSPPGHG